MTRIAFEKLSKEDFEALFKWLNKDHVMRWYTKHKITYEKVVEKYSKYLEVDNFVDGFIILIDNNKVGYIQTYKINNLKKYQEMININQNYAGIDLFLGEEDYVHKGYGSKIIEQFITDIIYPSYEVDGCLIGPDPGNIIAISAYEKAGFNYNKVIFNFNDNNYEYIMIKDEVKY